MNIKSVLKVVCLVSVLFLIVSLLIFSSTKTEDGRLVRLNDKSSEERTPEVAGVSDLNGEVKNTENKNDEILQEVGSSDSNDSTSTPTPTPTNASEFDIENKDSSVIKTHVRVINPDYPSLTVTPAN